MFATIGQVNRRCWTWALVVHNEDDGILWFFMVVSVGELKKNMTSFCY